MVANVSNCWSIYDIFIVDGAPCYWAHMCIFRIRNCKYYWDWWTFHIWCVPCFVDHRVLVYKTQRQLEKLPPLRVPQRPFNRPANPEIGQLMKESNDLLNVRVLHVFTSHYKHAQRQLTAVHADFLSTPDHTAILSFHPHLSLQTLCPVWARAPPFLFSLLSNHFPIFCSFLLYPFSFSHSLYPIYRCPME